jgi:Zn-dependent protease
MQPNSLSKFCFGLGLATITAKGVLIWATGQFYDLSDSPLENHQLEVIGPANILVSVMAIIGLAGTTVAFVKGARGQMLYASTALNTVALLANPMTYAI